MKARACLLLATALAGCGGAGRADLESADPARRAAAVSRLGTSRDDRALAALLVAEQDPQPVVRRAAAEALGVRGGVRALDALAVLLVDPDGDVVAAAARSLRGIRPEGGSTDARAVADVQRRAARALALAYGRSAGATRREIAEALVEVGGSLREAVEAEARVLWDRNARVLRSGSAAGRAGAAEELGRSGRTEAVRALVPLLGQARSDPALAAAAARGLGWSTDPAAVSALEDALSGTPGEVAEAAAWALGNAGDAAAAEALDDLGSKGPARAAVAAVVALEGMPAAPDVGVALCGVALRAQDPEAAARAAAAARGREADCPDRVLAQRIARGGSDAVGALAALGTLHLPPDRVKAPAEKALGLLQSSPEARVRAAAMRALGLAPYPPAAAAIQRRAGAILDRAEKGSAPKGAAAKGGTGEGTQGAGALLEPGGRDELAQAVVALARLDPGSSFALAHRLATHPDPALRAAAARAIGIARPPDAVPRLSELLVDSDPAVRDAAAASLGPLGAPAVAPLAKAVAAADEEERAVVARALGATGDATAVPALVPLLSGPAAGAAATALGRLGGPAAATALLGVLAGPPGAGRVEVVEALAALGPPEAGEALSRELLSEWPELRAAAARGLGRLRFEGAAIRLESLRADYHADVRRAAVEALARLPSRGPPAAKR